MWQANFVSRATITVSAFTGEYDICPKDGPAAFFALQLSDCILHISKRNVCRLHYVLRLPTCQVSCFYRYAGHEAPIAGPSALTATSLLQVLEQFYTHGYQDAASFLKRLSK